MLLIVFFKHSFFPGQSFLIRASREQEDNASAAIFFPLGVKRTRYIIRCRSHYVFRVKAPLKTELSL